MLPSWFRGEIKIVAFEFMMAGFIAHVFISFELQYHYNRSQQRSGNGMDAFYSILKVPDNKVHWGNMGPTRVLSAPARPYVGLMNLAIRGVEAE